jgi:hypothetical protein
MRKKSIDIQACEVGGEIGKPVQTYTKGRKCIKCGRILSVYNGNNHCNSCGAKCKVGSRSVGERYKRTILNITVKHKASYRVETSSGMLNWLSWLSQVSCGYRNYPKSVIIKKNKDGYYWLAFTSKKSTIRCFGNG